MLRYSEYTGCNGGARRFLTAKEDKTNDYDVDAAKSFNTRCTVYTVGAFRDALSILPSNGPIDPAWRIRISLRVSGFQKITADTCRKQDQKQVLQHQHGDSC